MSTAQQLQRALEERAKEIVQLQNELQRAEADRQKWEHQKRVLESKQPPDVQALMRQKRELQTQLQREESEKQELFMQINKLIGDVNELQSKSDLTEVNQKLEAQLHQIKAENSRLKSQSDSQQQKFNEELNSKKQELDRFQKTHDFEVNRLNNELRKSQKDMEVKDAALESLKLARPSSKENSLEREIERLRIELTQRSQENSHLVAQKTELEQFKTRLMNELNQLKRQLEENQDKLNQSDRINDDLLEIFEHAGIPSTSGIGTLKRKIVSLKTDVNEEVLRRKKLETELDQLRQTLNSSNTARQELTRRIDELREENERLTEKASVEEELHTLMLSLRQAKAEISNKEAEATTWRQKAMRLEEQCDQLQADLSNKQSVLQKAEHDLHSLRSTAVDTEILAKLESELQDAQQNAEDQRQKLREAMAARERSEIELARREKELEEAKTQLEAANIKLEDFELKRQQLEQKKIDEIRRLRDDHKNEVARMRREFVDEKERIAEKITIVEEDSKKAQLNAEEIRQSVEEAQKKLAGVLSCSATFDIIIFTVIENERKLKEFQQQISSGDSLRQEQEAHLNNELRRLKDRELNLEALLSDSRESEQRLKDQIREMGERQRSESVETDERLKLLESDREELNKMNEELREKSKEEQQLHDTEMRNMRDEMIDNIKRLSDLLEAETKRLQQVNSERDRWLHEAQLRERECIELRKQLEARIPNGTSNSSDLRTRIAELEDENAKLAGDLLKLESSGTNSAIEKEFQQAQRRFNEEQGRWRLERIELENKIDELKKEQNQNGQLTNGLNSLNGNPTPKPRKINGPVSPSNISNLTSESSSADESFSAINGGVDSNMKSELEKQKRLINVLRKKLQHQQIERVQQSRSFCAIR